MRKTLGGPNTVISTAFIDSSKLINQTSALAAMPAKYDRGRIFPPA
jgi:hypothetical protein